jgi:hypothetical protein
MADMEGDLAEGSAMPTMLKLMANSVYIVYGARFQTRISQMA